MSIHNFQAIDVHAHYGTYIRGVSELNDRFSSADAHTVVAYAERANTKLTVVSPFTALTPRRHNDAVKGNTESEEIITPIAGLMYWVVVNPLMPATYVQAKEMLEKSKCAGIKIHPEEHGYHIKEHAEEIFEFASEQHTIVLTHSGEQNSLPEDMVLFANEFPQMTLILAHLGCGWDGNAGHQVRALKQAAHDNVYIDTSSAQNVLPQLIEWAVSEIGAEKLLYGTDSPCYYAPMQRARIDYAAISEDDKRKILHDNAVAVLRLDE